MTNPSNIVRVRARTGGRASVYEANAWCQAFSSGLLEGTGVIQNTTPDMNVLVGGSAAKPDVVIASNPSGYKIALDIVGQQAVTITAPASSTRISAIVAYTNDLSVASTETTTTGSPASCGLIVVNGTAASSPVAPNDSTIRAAITADGATGSQACYAILATITVTSATTTITDSLITRNSALMAGSKLQDASVTSDKTNFTSTTTTSGGYTWQKLQLSNKVIIWAKATGVSTSSYSFVADGWGSISVPTGLDSLRTSGSSLYPSVNARCVDNAISFSSMMNVSDNTNLNIQYNNLYSQAISQKIYWSAVVVEILP